VWACRAVLKPFWLETLPSIRHHLVGGEVRISRLRQLGREFPGGVGGERLAEALAMVKNRLSVFGVENGFEFCAWSKRRRRVFLFFFLYLYLLCIWGFRRVRLRSVAFAPLLSAFGSTIFAFWLALFPACEPSVRNHRLVGHGRDNCVHLFRLAAEEAGQPVRVVALYAAALGGLRGAVHQCPCDGNSDAWSHASSLGYAEPLRIGRCAVP
jgi:hypothetical protein